MKYYAIPLKDDGTERLGTFGVISKETTDRGLFLYSFSKWRDAKLKYNMYTYNNGKWNLFKEGV